MSSHQTPRLADQLRTTIRLRRLHKLRHPAAMGQPEVEAVLRPLVNEAGR